MRKWAEKAMNIGSYPYLLKNGGIWFYLLMEKENNKGRANQ